MRILTPQELHDILAYDPEEGTFTWKVKPAYWKAPGTVAGCVRGARYRVITWRGVHYPGSHVAWAMVHGRWPEAEIDHIDRNPSNDRIANLREASSAENKRNRVVRRDSGTGVKGVRFHKPTGRYQARIRHVGREVHIGLFDTLAEAEAAYVEMAKKLHGHFNPAALDME